MNGCDHEFSEEVSREYMCETPYCHVTEKYCVKCHRYVRTCGCHYNDDTDGWSLAQRRQQMQKMVSMRKKKML